MALMLTNTRVPIQVHVVAFSAGTQEGAVGVVAEVGTAALPMGTLIKVYSRQDRNHRELHVGAQRV